jgi:hypothetical protein
VALERVENDAVIGQHIRRSWSDFQGCRDQPQRFGRAALLMLEHTCEMQRIEIDGIGAKDGVIDLPRLIQPALPMQGKRLLNGRRSRSARRARVPVHALYRSPNAAPSRGRPSARSAKLVNQR